MSQYDRAIAPLYDHYASGLPGDVQFYSQEAQRSGSPVLELGCGTGRILFPIAKLGIDIVGLDSSSAMLTVAKDKLRTLPSEVQRHVEIVEGDMRDYSLGRQFNLVMAPYRAFLNLLTVEEQRKALSCIRKHLTDGGRLILDFFNPRYDVIAAECGPLGSALRKRGEFTHPDTGLRGLEWVSRHCDPEAQIVKIEHIYEVIDQNGRVVSKTYVPLTFRYIFRYEMLHLLELCGFRVEALYGDFQRGQFKYDGQQIWVACPDR